MFYEEKFDGQWFYRTTPNGEWIEFSVAQYLDKLEENKTTLVLHSIKQAAREWGSALNAASWKFGEAYSRIIGGEPSPRLSDHCKAIIRDCILEYLDKVKID